MPQTSITITVNGESQLHSNVWYFLDSTAVNRATETGVLDGKESGIEIILAGQYIEDSIAPIGGRSNIRADVVMVDGSNREFDIMFSEPTSGYGQSVTRLLGQAVAR